MVRFNLKDKGIRCGYPYLFYIYYLFAFIIYIASDKND